MDQSTIRLPLWAEMLESFERGLLDHFSVAETFDEIFRNKIYSTLLDGINFDEDRGIGMHDLNLAFRNPRDLYADSATEDHRLDEYRSREDKKFMVGSGSNQWQPNEVLNRGMWNPSQGTQLQSGLANPHAQSQSPSSYHSFDIMSNKQPLSVPLDGLNLDDKLHFVEEPVEIVGREVKRLKRSRIPLVKVRWNSKRGPEFTWEREDQFKKKYPHLFTKTTPSSSVAS
ncbi:hypothetical protein Tco_0291233 [Tanacetum coccineum]